MGISVRNLGLRPGPSGEEWDGDLMGSQSSRGVRTSTPNIGNDVAFSSPSQSCLPVSLGVHNYSSTDFRCS